MSLFFYVSVVSLKLQQNHPLCHIRKSLENERSNGKFNDVRKLTLALRAARTQVPIMYIIIPEQEEGGREVRTVRVQEHHFHHSLTDNTHTYHLHNFE